MARSWIVAVVAAIAGCTAANPAFGDDTSSGKADPGTQSTSDSTPSTSTANTSASAGTGTTGDSASMTSDDMSETTDPTIEPATTENPTDSESATSDVTGMSGRKVILYAATMSGGQLGEKKMIPAEAVGEEICLAAYAGIPVDVCDGHHRALLRFGQMPLVTPELMENLQHPVISASGEPIAMSLQAFIDGDWQVPELQSIESGNLEMLGGGSLATGGLSNEDFNCQGWTTTNGDVTLGVVSGGDGWFAGGGTQGCSSSAHFLCVCLPA